jgi:uncharacterized protein (TIGR00255 family)
LGDVLKSTVAEGHLSASISSMGIPGEPDHMIRSMTGFGQSSAELAGVRLIIELRSVNHRYADIRFRLPSDLAAMEGDLRRRIKGRVSRGRVEVAVRVERLEGATSGPMFNGALLDEVLAAAHRLAGEHELSGQLDLATVLSMPGMFRQDTPEILWGEEEQKRLLGAFDGALDGLDADRRREGGNLQGALLKMLTAMKQSTGNIRRRAEEVPQIVRDKLLQRIEALAGQIDLDAARVAQEAAHLADKCDVTEEIVRLEGHLAQADTILAGAEDKPVGKRLDFLVQEIIRETNTICSKSSDLELTRSALDLRAGVEKVREQVQNLE